jgi:HEPN domain-containing protein
MKKLLISLDNLATAKLNALADLIIVRFKLDEKDRANAYPLEKQKFKSTYPPNQPSLEEWCKEYRVSMLYDRQTIYIGG